MSRAKLVCLIVLSFFAPVAQISAQEHEHGSTGQRVKLGAQAVGLVTRVSPAVRGEDLTEGYITQPSIAAHALYGPFRFMGMLNLEGLTLARGELNPGSWGEGYVDRRHPHTYLHEAVVTLAPRVLNTDLSISAGKGFAPFGTDDPMVRGFVKYPANHHLAQILERWVLIGAVRRGAVMFEAGLFNGDEPLGPTDLGSFERFGDSWSARATLLPAHGVELQASYADVTSPEQPAGGGLDHTAWNISARLDRQFRSLPVYALVELGRAGEGRDDLEIFHFNTVLAETAIRNGDWQTALRFERSDRPEEERTVESFPYRSVRPATDNNILGTTRWTSMSVQLSRIIRARAFSVQPLIEIARYDAKPNEEPAILEPNDLFGSRRIWSMSAGMRATIGTTHTRMGRYGAASTTH